MGPSQQLRPLVAKPFIATAPRAPVPCRLLRKVPGSAPCRSPTRPPSCGATARLRLPRLRSGLRHLELPELLITLPRRHLMTPYIYGSLEFAKLFDMIALNLSLRRPYEVSKAVTFIPVPQRRKATGDKASSASPRAAGPEWPGRPPRGEASIERCGLPSPHHGEGWGRPPFCFRSGLHQGARRPG